VLYKDNGLLSLLLVKGNYIYYQDVEWALELINLKDYLEEIILLLGPDIHNENIRNLVV